MLRLPARLEAAHRVGEFVGTRPRDRGVEDLRACERAAPVGCTPLRGTVWRRRRRRRRRWRRPWVGSSHSRHLIVLQCLEPIDQLVRDEQAAPLAEDVAFEAGARRLGRRRCGGLDGAVDAHERLLVRLHHRADVPVTHAVDLAEAQPARRVGGRAERAEGGPHALARATVRPVEEDGPVGLAPVGPAYAAAAAAARLPRPHHSAQHAVAAELRHARVERIDGARGGVEEHPADDGDDGDRHGDARV